ncbi:multidrug efflux system outer membrane protein/multidrug efflux system outer membrane protein [Sphaerotilus hippei]|uniref:Multidrug efflux system outer membrane protein/multidrug efflux system outer membrane protein n=1 Tax=Sphaerotilus hippei TaxID=744406 RepID=A0A318H6Z7_9BURK|nr:efflux transporter outer membrane subunit [Sphaerotilus hippei]PXW97405.1 multidrug efflux system outer membrane protein/multidrug efflux system outer membrane protein [Sphaerotilus hippei]
MRLNLSPMTVATLLALALLGGCASLGGPAAGDGTPAATAVVPATLAAPAVSGGAALPGDGAALDWRPLVRDDRLVRLIDQALVNNRDLRLATLAIDAARAQYRITDANRLPTVNASVAGSASRSAADLSGGTASTSRQVSVSLGMAAWELDLWGRLASLKDSALSTYLATGQTRASVQASLVTEVAQAWLTLAADRQRELLARQTLETRQRSLELTQRRQALGVATALDLASAQASAETARGDLASAAAQVVQDHNALRLLLGAEPDAALLPGADGREADQAATLLTVPADLPSSVLLRRPDVRSAELTLQAARADVEAARAALFPTLTLTASAGTASNALTGLFAAGNGIWSLAPTLKLPILDGGASRSALEIARIGEQQQRATYDKAIQTAFREVADALAVRASLAERLDAQQRLVDAYARSLELVTRRQQAGAESTLAVLDAQRSLYSAQQALITLRLTEQANRLTLFKVLGGT